MADLSRFGQELLLWVDVVKISEEQQHKSVIGFGVA